jgi:hypothetical protein
MTKTASESELTARAQQPDDPNAKAPEYRVAEIRDDTTAIVELEDGRMVPATFKEGTQLKKGDKVAIKSDGEDKGGAPLKVEITRVL